MDSMTELIGYNHIFSTVYHPQTNEMVERFNATFVPQLAKLQDREHNNWDEYLLPIVFAYNTEIHATTQYSPYQLQFRREPHLPTDESSTSFIFNKPNDYYDQLKKGMLRSFNNKHVNILLLDNGNTKVIMTNGVTDPHYKINAFVLIKSHGLKTKLEQKYSITPKIIIKEQHPTYWVKDEHTQIANLECMLMTLDQYLFLKQRDV
ncbi:unnamed protein product [Rotaria socialis]|uniref:Integrase catalytic domain-containing protein n=1 Tax=Rotaria socialis TaxID=392032 RepID=A0A821KDF7_9BILA|nr:unnamed protein product [Rotaria socialis]CAF4736474.1 unnamed protein product [Rotaria socialis]